MNNQFTVGKDGITYRSKFEADFSNKFLYGYNVKYEYEKLYEERAKKKCDFYLTDYDIWIECVYHGAEVKPVYCDGRIIKLLNAQYHDRHFIKTFGAKWNGNYWWIKYSGYPLDSLHQYMLEEDKKLGLFTDSKALTEQYDRDLLEKIFNKKFTIIIVNKDDIDNYNSLAHLIMAKGTKMIYSKIIHKVLDQRLLV